MKSKSLISIVTLMFASLASSSFVNPSNENPLSKNYVVKRASGDVYQSLDAYEKKKERDRLYQQKKRESKSMGKKKLIQ